MPIHYSPQYWNNCWASVQGLDSQIKGTILGAGLGKRLDPLTAHHLPKPMFPLGGKVPIAEVWVRRFIRSGISNVSMNLCVLAESIKRHFGVGAKFGMDLTYVEETVPTGTLGGICKMALGRDAKLLRSDSSAPPIPAFSGSTIIAPSGDIVANFDSELLGELYGIHRKAGAALTMVLTKISPSRRIDFGTVVLRAPENGDGILSLSGPVQDFREKDLNSPSCLSNASIYIIETELLKVLDKYRTDASADIKEPFYDFGKHVFPAMLGGLPYVTLPRDYALWGVQFDGPWFDVGNKRDYLRVNERVLDGTIEIPLTYELLPWGYLGSNSVIDFSKVDIRSPVVIGNDCIIEPGAVLGPYAVIGDGWIIEGGAEITHSVLWERYPYFLDGAREISVKHRLDVDRHEIRRGVRVHESIIAGGRIEADTIEKTVDVRENGELAILPIDYLPSETRP
jgi:mannose-1-phosphate guanylyltransferase/phosphomannomutase